MINRGQTVVKRLLLILAALALALTLAACPAGSSDSGPAILSSYGISHKLATESGLPAGWPAELVLPPGCGPVRGGSGTGDTGAFSLVTCRFSGSPKDVLEHFRDQSVALGHTRSSFELSPEGLAGSTSSPTQSLLIEALKSGSGTELRLALTEDRDEFFEAGHSGSSRDMALPPPGYPSERLPLFTGVDLKYAYFDGTRELELDFECRASADEVRSFYRSHFESSGFSHMGEISSETPMIGDEYSRGSEGAAIEIYQAAKGRVSVICRYGDGSGSIWD